MPTKNGSQKTEAMSGTAVTAAMTAGAKALQELTKAYNAAVTKNTASREAEAKSASSASRAAREET